MRIWGWVLLILGFLFLLLFTLAEFGGGHLGFVPFFVSGFLILMGFRLRASGKGIVQAKPAAADQPGVAQSAPPAPAAAPAVQFSTVELPLTPDVAAVVATQKARTRRILLWIVGGMLVLFVGLGVVLGATDHTPGEGQTFFLFFAGIGIISAGLIYGISWLTTQKPVRRDLAGTTYLRTTGPVSVVRMGSGGMLRLADRAFLMDGRYGMKELSVLGYGTVDYTPHGHVILAVWNREGRCVYTLPAYGPASGT
jgi:hypothetical protein